MNHAASYPCGWCLANKNDLGNLGEMRTLSGCNKNFKSYRNNNSVKKDARKFKNCVNATIIKTDKELILDALPPPELHLLIGSVNHMFEQMAVQFPYIASLWAKQCHVYKVDVYRGKLGFQGNACRILLKNVDKLRAICNKCDLQCLKFVDTFQCLNEVVDSCFSINLKPNFEAFIDNFRKSFKKLNISTTVK